MRPVHNLNTQTSFTYPISDTLLSMNTLVNCPICSVKVEWKPENRYRPFCSERCKRTDLGTWAAEKYVIGGTQEAPATADSNNDLD